MEVTIEAGDLLLVCRPCHRMDLFTMSLCYGAKVLGNTDWDHLGIVVEDPESHELFLLEANANGVTLYPLRDRLQRSKATMFAVRKLMGSRDAAYKQSLWELAHRYNFRKYNDSYFHLTSAMLASYQTFFSQVHTLSLSQRRLQADVNVLTKHLQQHTQPPAGQVSLLDAVAVHRRAELLQEISLTEARLAALSALSPAPTTPATDSNSKYFCSQLVAEILIELNGMSAHRLPYHYIPADFSSSSVVPAMASSLHASAYRYSADLVLAKESIAQIDHADGKVTVRLKKEPFQLDLNVGDVLPPNVTAQLTELADGLHLSVRGDIHILTPAHTAEQMDTQDVTVLGVLRQGMDSQVIMQLLKQLQKQHKDIYLQAEQRSRIALTDTMQLPGKTWSDEDIALQQRAFVVQDAWEASWRGLQAIAHMKPLQHFHGYEKTDIKLFLHAIRQYTTASVAGGEALWELFNEVVDLKVVLIPDAFHPKKHRAPSMDEVLLLFLLFEQFMLSPSKQKGGKDANQKLFEYFVRAFVTKYHHSHSHAVSKESVDKVVAQICATAVLVKSASDEKAGPTGKGSLFKLMWSVPVIACGTAAWRSTQHKPSASVHPPSFGSTAYLLRGTSRIRAARAGLLASVAVTAYCLVSLNR